MSKQEGVKKQLPFWEGLRGSKGLYRRLFGYVKPYKWRFVVGLVFGLLFGVVNSTLPMVVAQVSTAIFSGPMLNPKMLLRHREMLSAGLGSIPSRCCVC